MLSREDRLKTADDLPEILVTIAGEAGILARLDTRTQGFDNNRAKNNQLRRQRWVSPTSWRSS